MTNRITIADVAREAGVSMMTVSRVVNGKDGVSSATRRHVQAVVDRLGYTPSDIARGLVTKRTGALGLVIPDVSNPFFSEVARGAEHVAYAQGYNVYLCNTEEDVERELAVLRSLEEKRVDGVVLCSSRLEDEQLRAAMAGYRGAVLVNRQLEPLAAEDGVQTVMLDDLMGGRIATQHLLEAGHKAVGFLAGPPASRSGKERAEGYRAALADADLPRSPEWTRHCFPTAEGGQPEARELLTAHPELTALFCYNDLVAVGALHACVELGRRVPEDVAVVGCDDIPLAALVTPPLTTLRQPRYQLGKRAMEVLLGQIEGSTCEEGEHRRRRIVLQPELIVRASAPRGCGGPRTAP